MSRFPILIACLILFLATIPTLVQAQPTLRVVPETTTPTVGEVVTFQVTVTGADELTAVSCIFDQTQPEASSFYGPVLLDEFGTDYAYTSPGPKTATCELRNNFGAVLTDPVVVQLTVGDGPQVFLPLVVQ